MHSFPLMRDLPTVVDTVGWTWEPFTAPVAPSYNFWLGTDRDGNRWLTKLTGAFYAYREIVFARLAQAMNWSCQSSVFMRLDKESRRALGRDVNKIHAAHWFLDEHPIAPCCANCAFKFLIGRPVRTLEDLMGSDISHPLDWPKSEFAAYLFGGNEPPGRLFTTSHEFVIIDSELMFGTGPCEFDTAQWWNEPGGRPSRSGRELAREVCSNLTSLSEQEIENALRLPAGVAVTMTWPIAPKLRASRMFDATFCSSHART